MKQLKYFSTFSGIAGFELGIQQAYETIASKNNQSIIKECCVKNVKNKESSTKGGEYAKSVYENTNLNGELKTLKKVERQEENIMLCEDKGYLKCMEKNVPVVGKKRKNSLHLNTKTRMVTKTGKDMEQDICTNSHLKKIIKKNTKSSAITATMQKQDMENAPICVGYSEIDKYAIQIYEKHFPTHRNFGDITKIKASELPDFDMLVGGIPCQSWSIAGKRGGFNDERGNMWFECFRILKEKKPKFFLFENVKGLLSHDGGKSMERICEELCECKYAIDFEILNSKNFGVAQNRQRVFIVGVRLDLLDKCQLF